MAKFKVDVDAAEDAEHLSPAEPATDEAPAESGPSSSDATAVAVTVGVVVVGAAVIEAALIPAILVGAAAALAPKYLPKLGERLQPLFNASVRGAMKLSRKARTAVGEAKEKLHDIAAEVHAEEAAAAEGAETAA